MQSNENTQLMLKVCEHVIDETMAPDYKVFAVAEKEDWWEFQVVSTKVQAHRYSLHKITLNKAALESAFTYEVVQRQAKELLADINDKKVSTSDLAEWLKKHPGPQRIMPNVVAQYMGELPYDDDWSKS